MAVTYNATIKNSRMEAVRGDVANGTLELLEGATVIATFGLDATAGSVTGDTWTLAFDATTVAAGASTTTGVNAAQIKNSGGTALITGLTVGTAAADIIIDNTSINSGQNVSISGASIQHAA